VGEVVDLIALLPEQHFTEPPPRYSEATLIKALEENGVGRPSTYATIVTVIQDRGYVIKAETRLRPTDLGFIVCDALVDTFSDIMDVAYTAGMEAQLDRVAGGEVAYRQMLGTFYERFAPELEQAGAAMPGAVERALWAGLPADVAGRTCPECGRPLQVRVSDAGRFLGCSGYPDCHYTLDLKNPTEGRPEATYAEGETCELCGGRMKIIVRGRAQFLGCEHYPTCKNTRPILSERIKRLATETACPQCGLRPLMAMKGRFGEYLRCPQCAANYSLAKLGLGRARHSHGESGPAAESEGEAVPATTIEQVDVACPQCGQRPMERRVGRYGPYFRCPACKKNTSAKKMALYLGESAGDDVSD
jgi:DNA topoisomerase-1